MLVAAILPTHQLYLGRMALVQDGIIENQAGVITAADQRTDGLPNRIRRNIILHQETIYGIVRKLGIMLSHIGLSEICNGCNDELTVILSCRL